MSGNFRSDYELIYLINENDDLAFEEIIDKYKGLMKQFLYQYKNLFQDQFDVHELFQITLLSLYQAAITYNENEKCSFVTYLKVIMRRDILMYARKQNKNYNRVNRNTVSLDQYVWEESGAYLLDFVENNQPDFNPEDSFKEKERQKELLELLYSYGEEDAEIFLMWMQGYTYEEISSRFHLVNKQVDYKIQKIKKKLKGSIDYDGSL